MNTEQAEELHAIERNCANVRKAITVEETGPKRKIERRARQTTDDSSSITVNVKMSNLSLWGICKVTQCRESDMQSYCWWVSVPILSSTTMYTKKNVSPPYRLRRQRTSVTWPSDSVNAYFLWGKNRRDYRCNRSSSSLECKGGFRNFSFSFGKTYIYRWSIYPLLAPAHVRLFLWTTNMARSVPWNNFSYKKNCIQCIARAA